MVEIYIKLAELETRREVSQIGSNFRICSLPFISFLIMEVKNSILCS